MRARISAIADFKVPANRTDLRSFCSLATGLGKFTPQLAKKMEPLRDLLKVRNNFVWYPDHTKAFEEVKKLLTEAPNLTMYNPEARTRLEVDSSRTGLGYILMQEQGRKDSDI